MAIKTIFPQQPEEHNNSLKREAIKQKKYAHLFQYLNKHQPPINNQEPLPCL